MHRPRRLRRSLDIEADGTFRGRDGTFLSNPRFHGAVRERNKRRKMALGGAIALFFIVGYVAFHSIVNTDYVGDEKVDFEVFHPSFTSTSKATVPNAHATVEMFKHEKTGLEIMTVLPNDLTQDATFGISFRTPIDSNAGLATIVEHAVQTGSKKYPVKDPIRMVQAGSLQTHWESWSERDRSSFVLSSRNLKDFKNSMSVIADGLFHSLMTEDLHKWVYRQEGWRLEMEDTTFDLSISGNAYNRAKAAQMFPQEVLDIHKYSHLFKGHHYEYEPKGLWRDIVSGVRGKMINFYESWYRPNNAKAFCYGRGDYINACLDILDEAITSFDTDKEAFDSTIPFLKLDDITGNLLMRQSYPSFEEDKDYRLAVSWVLNDEAMDSRTEVSWFLIKELLIGSATSIISKVVEPFGDDFIGSLDSNLQQWVLTMGASGLAHENDANKAQNAMNQALNLISQNGFEKETLKAAMNKVEFQLRDLNSKCGVPQGVKMFKDVLTKWNYDLDPKLALDWYTEFVELKKELEDPDNTEAEEALIELVTKFLITSKAKSSVILSPSSTMQQQARNDEIEWLNDSPNVWSQQQGNEILGETTELHREQERGDSPIDLAKLPRLSIEDIKDEPFDETKMVIREDVFSSGVTLIENEVVDSNGIGYVDFALDLSLLKFDDVILIPLLCRLMVESGISFQTDVEMQNKIDTYTGGLTIEPIVEEVYEFKDKTGGYMVDSGRHMVTKIVVRSSVFADKHPAELFSIIKQVIWDSDIDDQEKTINILQDMIDDMEDNIQRHGHDFATRRIEARYSLPCFIREQWFGVTQLFKARNALQEAKENWDDFIVRLLQMQDAVKRIHHSGMLMSITGDKKTIKNLAGSSSVFFQDLLPKSAQKEPFPDFGKVDHPWVKTGNDDMNKNFEVESPFSAFLVPTLVNDVTKGGLLYEVGDHISGAHIAAAHYLSGFYMNDKIRFNLGAQEAWARLDLDSGVMVYQSEGVPDINPIIDIFDEAPTWVQGQMSGIEYLPLEAEAAIVSAIGKMDGSRLQANQIGYVSLIRYIKQDKKEARRQWRDEALGATRHDFTDFVSKIGGWLNPSICAITNRNMLDIARDKMQQNLTACSITGYSCP